MKTLETRLHCVEWLAENILGFEFRPVGPQQLPAVTAGAHIDLHLPAGLVRSYSLVNAPGETHRYVVVVLRDAAGRGGSKYLHDTLRVGDRLTITTPRNNFPLHESAEQTVFIAGGIGVTPLWCMAQRLAQIGSPWILYYSARTRESAAFVNDLSAFAAKTGGVVHFNFDDGVPEKMLDLKAIVQAAAPRTHLYCCGPISMLTAFEAATRDCDPDVVHREYFSAPSVSDEVVSAGEDFVVHLAKSDRTIQVNCDETLLDALLAAGVDAPHSCLSGICRVCETRIVAGEADHRDYVLTEAERQSGDTMIICCSRAKSRELVLDL